MIKENKAKREKVLVTGVGVISPIGNNQSSYWDSLIRPGDILPDNYPGLEPEQMTNRLLHQVKIEKEKIELASDLPVSFESLGFASQQALIASQQALEDANLDAELRNKAGVSFATAMGDSDLIESARVNQGKPEALDNFIYRVSSIVASAFSLYGPNHSVSTACSAGLYSICFGMETIRNGEAEIMLVGGSEGFSRVAMGCFNRMGALDPRACKPFDADRQGTEFGEGSAVMVLESESHAMKRKDARVYGEIKGYGWSCDAYHPTAPEPEGNQIELALRRALLDSDINTKEVDCVIPHATGTQLNDLVEAQVIKRVFNGSVNNIKVSAIKSKIGHNGGAAGSFSCLTAALVLANNEVPTTSNIGDIDEECNLNIIRDSAWKGKINNVLVNAYAFGGNNVSIILGRYNGR